MKYFIAIALIAAVASAGVHRPSPLAGEYAELEAIFAAINSPSTDPATAVALEAMLHDLLGIAVGPAIVDVNPVVVVDPISISPAPVSPIADFEAIVAAIHSPSTDPATAAALEAMLNDLLGAAAAPISVGPAIVDVEPTVVVEHEPIVISPAPINPAPVVTPVAPAPIAEVESAASPLVQIIVNVQKAEDVASVVAPVPVAPVPSPVEEVYVPGPVNVAHSVDIIPVEPVLVGSPVIVDPVLVATPVIVDPVQVVSPVVVAPIQVGTPVLPTPVEPVLIGTPIITPGHAVNPIESLN